MPQVIDGSLLWRFREMRRLTQNALALLAGCDEHRISYLENDKGGSTTLDLATRLAKAIGVPLDALLKPDARSTSGPDWQVVEWHETDRLAEFLQEMRDGRHCIVCTQGIDSYLVPDPFVTWSERSRLEELGWPSDRIERRLRGWDNYVRKQRESRQDSDLTHRIVCPAAFFARAFSHESGWLCDIDKTFESWRQQTAIAIMPPTAWRDMASFIVNKIGFAQWDKIAIVDDCLALFRPTRELFMFTRDTQRILQWTTALETVAECYTSDFPKRTSLRPSAFEGATNTARETLHKIHAQIHSANRSQK